MRDTTLKITCFVQNWEQCSQRHASLGAAKMCRLVDWASRCIHDAACMRVHEKIYVSPSTWRNNITVPQCFCSLKYHFLAFSSKWKPPLLPFYSAFTKNPQQIVAWRCWKDHYVLTRSSRCSVTSIWLSSIIMSRKTNTDYYFTVFTPPRLGNALELGCGFYLQQHLIFYPLDTFVFSFETSNYTPLCEGDQSFSEFICTRAFLVFFVARLCPPPSSAVLTLSDNIWSASCI